MKKFVLLFFFNIYFFIAIIISFFLIKYPTTVSSSLFENQIKQFTQAESIKVVYLYLIWLILVIFFFFIFQHLIKKIKIKDCKIKISKNKFFALFIISVILSIAESFIYLKNLDFILQIGRILTFFFFFYFLSFKNSNKLILSICIIVNLIIPLYYGLVARNIPYYVVIIYFIYINENKIIKKFLKIFYVIIFFIFAVLIQPYLKVKMHNNSNCFKIIVIELDIFSKEFIKISKKKCINYASNYFQEMNYLSTGYTKTIFNNNAIPSLERLILRTEEITNSTAMIYMIDQEYKPLLKGETYKNFKTMFLPRFFFKNKEIENIGIYPECYFGLYQEYKEDFASCLSKPGTKTSINLNVITEAYINFKYYGLIFCSLLFSGLLCIVEKLNKKSDKILKAMGINLFAQVISYYGNLTLVIGSILVNFIPIAVLLLLINEKK